jgi:DGQHR domain-containing protein
MNTEPRSITFPAFRVTQPLGDFFVGVISCHDLCGIAVADVRRMKVERGFETYLGVQRPLDNDRKKDIHEYVQMLDATFPTSIVIAVDGKCARWNEDRKELTLSEYLGDKQSADGEGIPFERVANILDGQHRIAGLLGVPSTLRFDLNVAIFVDIDIAEQASIFATVNLAQTKVNRSLAYDLMDLAKSRSPQKTCHAIAVALDRTKDSPLFKRIKRLGVATEGRFDETLTQATFVDSLMPLISLEPRRDRDLLMRGKSLDLETGKGSEKVVFRSFFIANDDISISRTLLHYFEAIAQRWPTAWARVERGNIINRTNGFRAFMRLLGPLCLFARTAPGAIVTKDQFLVLLERCTLSDHDFTTDRFPPGTGGEAALFRRLKSDILGEGRA